MATVGALRLRLAGFASMPRFVASVAVVGGAAVVGFGVLLQITGPPPVDEGPSARATLDPVDSDERAPAGRAAADDGVRGTVVGTSGEPVAGIKVTLSPLFMEKGIEPVSDVTDDDGAFRFDDVDVNPGSPWIAEVTFDGARFPSDVMRAPRGKDDPLKLVVAETTKKPSDIEFRAESLAIVGDASGAQAVHALTVVNSGERAYVGGLRLPLLRTATAIQEGSGLDRRYLSLQQGEMVSIAPVVPGTHDLTYTYVVQMQQSGIAVDRRVTRPTARYELLVGEGLRLASADGLRDDGDVTLGPRDASRTYRRYVASDLEPDDRLRATVDVARRPSVLRIGLSVAAVVVLLAVVLVPLLRRRRRSPPNESAPATPQPATER